MPIDTTGRDGSTRLKSQKGAERRDFLKIAGALVASVSLVELLQACRRALPVVPPELPPVQADNQTAAVTPVAPPPAEVMPAPLPPPPVSSLRARIAVVLRRAGFGASKSELDRFEAMGLEGTIDYLLNYETVDDTTLENYLESLQLDLTKAQHLQRWWLLRMLGTQRPLQEKMVLFWHGLLTSGMSRVGKAELMLEQNHLFRRMALGSFPSLLKSVSRDPAMLIWLDSRSNKKSAPNENFARELMELFTMGVGNYSESDVRESARAFTGSSLRKNEYFFDPAQFDNGTKSFLGESGIFNGDDIIDIIMKHPATSDFICRKLFSFFAYDPPDAGTITRMRRAFTISGYNIRDTMRELLTSEAFYAAGGPNVRIKSPVELVAGTLRSLAIKTDATGLPALLTRMGQTVFDPPDVAGWPGRATWVNSSTLLERINFANRIATDRKSFNPQADVAKYSGGSSPEEVTDYFSKLLIDEDMPPSRRRIFDTSAQAFSEVDKTDVSTRAVIYLLLSSPDYQLV
ncbi:MAG: DUF1800 domain-containing protein [Dehalococcoidales bacterium]|nr:DUF1800 domain-containing protein [Dehalococcoidales bacterium]